MTKAKLVRLNPFAFPPETNQRFGLFAAAAFMLAVNMAGFFVALLPPDPTPTFVDETLPTAAEQFAYARDAAFATFQSVAGVVCILIAGVLAVSAAAIAIYRSHPLRIRRRKALRQDAAQDRALQAGVESLSEEVGLSPVPVVEVQPGSTHADGQAFGFPRKPSIRLGGRMALLMRRAPHLFRAIVLHEMAHIANGDIGRTYFTQALTFSVLSLAIAPLAIYAVVRATIGFGRRVLFSFTGQPAEWGLFFTDVLPSVALTIIPPLLSLLLVLALRASILRVREVYADWKVAVWGAEEGLTEILARAQKHEASSYRPAWLRLHPTPGERLALLRSSEQLFRVTPDIPGYAGLLAGITLTGMAPLVLRLFTASVAGATAITALVGAIGAAGGSALVVRIGILITIVTGILSALILIVPVLVITIQVAGSLGLQVMREVVAEFATRQHTGLVGLLRLLLPAALFSVGMQIGFLLVPFSFLIPLSQMVLNQFPLRDWVRAAAETLAWMILMAGLVWLVLVFLRLLSGRIIGEHTGISSPRGKRRALVTIATLLLWAILVPGIAWQFYIYRHVWLKAAMPLLPIVGGVTAASLVFGGLVAGVGLIWVAAQILLTRPRCPACNTRTLSRKVIGKLCHHCGADLSSWLFV